MNSSNKNPIYKPNIKSRPTSRTSDYSPAPAAVSNRVEVTYNEDFEEYETDFEESDEDDSVREATYFKPNADKLSTKLASNLELIDPSSALKLYPPSIAKNVKRFNSLKSIIQLDICSYDLFELQPLNEYELYIRNYGKNNTEQACTQTNEELVERETMAEDWYVSDRWTQAPPHQLIESAQEPPELPWLRIKYDKIQAKMKNVEEIEIVKEHPGLKEFLLQKYPIISTLLLENAGDDNEMEIEDNSELIRVETQLDLPYFSEDLFVSESAPAIVIAGSMDGSISVWDTREHVLKTSNFEWQWPSYTTDCLSIHQARIIHVWSNQTTSSISNDSFSFNSIDEQGIVQKWTLQKDPSDSDQRQNIGSTIKLVAVDYWKIPPLDKSHRDNLIDSAVYNAETKQLLVGADVDVLFAVPNNGYPKKYHPKVTKSDFYNRISSICQSNANWFLVGYENGQIAVFKSDYSLASSLCHTEHPITMLWWHPNINSSFLSLDSVGNIKIWDLGENAQDPIYDYPTKPLCRVICGHLYGGREKAVKLAAFADNGKITIFDIDLNTEPSES